MNEYKMIHKLNNVSLVMLVAFLGMMLYSGSFSIASAAMDDLVPDTDPVLGLIGRMRDADILGAAGELYKNEKMTRRKVSNLIAIALRVIENSREPVMGKDDLVMLSDEIMNYDNELALLFSENMSSMARQVIALDRMIKEAGEPVTETARKDRRLNNLAEINQKKEIDDVELMNRITISFVDADIKHVLRAVFAETPFNLALSNEISGKVTVQFKDVSLLDALKSILEQSGNAWQMENRIISVFPKSTKVTEKFSISYISSEEAMEFFNRWKTSAGIVQEDPTGNVFYLQDTWENIQKVRELLARLDQHRPEVEEVIEMIHLQHSEPAEMNRLVAPLLSPAGRIDINTRMKSLVVRDERRFVARIQELVKKLDVENEVVAQQTEIVRLKYANAPKLLSILKSEAFTGSNSDQRVGMVADERTNSLVLTGRPDRIRDLYDYIKTMDARVKQVSIQAKILEITLNDSTINGIDWETLIPTAVAQKSAGDGDISNAAENYFDINLGGGGSQKIQFGTLSYEQFHAVMDFLETRSNVKTVSTPTVITTDNHAAEISLGAKILFKLTGGEEATMQEEETGIKLNVTPAINPDNYITLDVQPEVSSPGSVTETGDLTIDQLNLNTKVIVRDKETLLIGGLIRDNETYATRRVPVLGNMPVIGNLFRDRNKSRQRKEIVMFISPRIIDMEKDSMNERNRRQFYEN